MLAAGIGLAVVVILVASTVSYYQLVIVPSLPKAPIQTQTTITSSTGSSTLAETEKSTAAQPSAEKTSFTFTVADSNTPWSFVSQGKNNPDIIASKDATVEVTFKNNGNTVHDFTITEFGVDKTKTQLDPGKEVTVTFKADKTGTFTYFCSQPGHKDLGMVGKFIVK